MKRLFWAIVALYAFVFIAMVIFQNIKDRSIEIISVAENLSMVIFPDEWMSVTIYFDKSDSFLLDTSLVSQAMIVCDQMSVPIQIETWAYIGETQYLDHTVYSTAMEFSISSIATEGTEYHWTNVEIHLKYDNLDTISISFGNWDVQFMNEWSSCPLDITYISMESRLSPFESLVNIRLRSSSVSELRIRSIRAWSSDMDSEFSGEEILSPLAESSYALKLTSHSNQPIHSRFPICIEYEYRGVVDIYMMDDYLFYRIFASRLEEIPYEKRVVTIAY